MPSYKLYYFDGRGRGEATRMLFAVGGCDFEDVRVSPEEWSDMKPKTPLGQIPVLEVDGKQLPQSGAIERYLAGEFGLLGSNSWEAAQIDAVYHTVIELMGTLLQIEFYEKDEEKKKAGLAKYYNGEAPRRMAGLTKLFEMYGGGDAGFFVGDKISLADINFFAMTEYFDAEELKKYPKMEALRSRVAANSRLAAFMKNRSTPQF
ncbi:S-crystallin SL11-like [Acanthaster planci]|uniref:glutathione transferase n=1 Tax=Acanthaster planci TaxID=133434 RepID=A0A8B7Y2W0_ACAPL|nr:S-crystallin SL11-like [Acanthaster planci]